VVLCELGFPMGRGRISSTVLSHLTPADRVFSRADNNLWAEVVTTARTMFSSNRWTAEVNRLVTWPGCTGAKGLRERRRTPRVAAWLAQRRGMAATVPACRKGQKPLADARGSAVTYCYA
jgi:hypothetical protein